MSGATEHDRLGSDTYKRLNVGLLVFNLISLLTMPAELGFFRRTTKERIYLFYYGSLCASLWSDHGLYRMATRIG